MNVFAQCLEVFLPSEKYKQASLKDRLSAEMLAARTSGSYYRKAREIARQKNLIIQTEVFDSDYKTALHIYCAMSRIFESEFPDEDFDELEKKILALADMFSEPLLKAYGWKEKAKEVA